MPFERLAGWLERYDGRHPETAWVYDDAMVVGVGPDGGRVEFAVPFPPLVECSAAGVSDHVLRPRHVGVVLVRRGGYAVADVQGAAVVASKIGHRHVQGRTKAGGWSQQRFARRRDNQAREAFEAATGHAIDLLHAVAGELDGLVVGGDRRAVAAVLADHRLHNLSNLPRQWVPVPGRLSRVGFAAALGAARSVSVALTDPPTSPSRELEQSC